ncbi:hypothetical protein RSJ10_472 [Clostridium botulinum]|nr:hypothetical protein RSJ10_472 [Clostridium botulinum]
MVMENTKKLSCKIENLLSDFEFVKEYFPMDDIVHLWGFFVFCVG